MRRWVVPRLLAWFRAHRRDLPWRRDRDPYRIWVSEVMLQQTQVATVIPFFERFVARFPTLVDLACADEQDVLRLWEGLGYYRRARHLLESARLLVQRYGGVLPADPEAWRGLPGLGDYTRNAVLSQAFDLRLPILEANSARVLSRLLGKLEDPAQGAAKRVLWQAAEELLPQKHVGDFNQALMELGALVCSSEKPDCPGCPLSARCLAFQSGNPQQFPQRIPKPPPTLVEEAAIIIRQRDRVLLLQRPPRGRWAGLWEFPHGSLLEGESHPDAARRIASEQSGMIVSLRDVFLVVRHGITRYRVTLVCFEADYLEGEFRSESHVQGIWVLPDQLTNYPISSPQRKLAKQLLTGFQKRLF